MTFRRVNTFDTNTQREGELLAQLVPSSPNSDETLFQHPGNNVVVLITSWTVTNDNNQDVEFIIYFDNAGTTYNSDNVIFKGTVTKSQTSPAGSLGVFMNNPNGSIGFEANDVDCVITIWGTIKPLG